MFKTSKLAIGDRRVFSVNSRLRKAEATGINGPGFLVPADNRSLMHWCLDRGLKIVFPAKLMAIGEYQEPAGAFLPSIIL
jgi:hypothetical protein